MLYSLYLQLYIFSQVDIAVNKIVANASLKMFDYLGELSTTCTKIKYDCEIFSICGHENFHFPPTSFYLIVYTEIVTGFFPGPRGKFANRK